MRDMALEWIEDRILESAGWMPAESRPPLELEEMSLFRHLAPEVAREVAKSVREISVAAGEKIFATGERGDEIFFVRRGRVHVLLPLEGGKRHHLATICRGEFFGEMAFLDLGSRSAEAVAATDTSLFLLSRRRFDEFVQQNQPLAGSVFESLALAIAQRLRVTDAEVRALEER